MILISYILFKKGVGNNLLIGNIKVEEFAGGVKKD